MNSVNGHSHLGVTAALSFLVDAFAGSDDPVQQDLHRALSNLRYSQAFERRRAYFDRVSAHVLRDGIEILLASPERGKREKMTILLANLDLFLADEPAPAPFAPATVRLWSEFIGVLGETAMEQQGLHLQAAWLASAAAWAEGLVRIARRGIAEADRRAA